MKKVAVIGSGPAGLNSIFSLLEDNSDLQVTLFESENEIGKRIKVSGNGRCNFFHIPINYNVYSSKDYSYKYMNLFMDKYEECFAKLGLLYFYDNEGRVYPLTNSGKTVIEVFSAFLKRKKVRVLLNSKVTDIKENNEKVLVFYNNNVKFFDDVILAVGGLSYLYNKEEKLNFLKKLNLDLTAFSPSLTPIKLEKYHNKNLEGKRFKVRLKLSYFNKILFTEDGEILFKKEGISGIVTFNLSAVIARLHLDNFDNFLVHIDFAPYYNEEELKKIIFNPLFTIEENLLHLFVKELKDELMYYPNDLINHIKDFKFKIISLYSFKDSQVTSGGISLDSIIDFALNKYPHIYPVGEVLDIDGPCGGYNIAFALASGYQVGKKILEKY